MSPKNPKKPDVEPAWTDYDKLVLYRRYEVADMLRDGGNALVLEIGNGWYIWDRSFGYSFRFPAFMPPNPNPYHPFGESLVASFVLTLRYADGSEEIISSNERCRTRPHGVMHTNVYGSEWIDGGELERDCLHPDYDDSAWDHALMASPTEIPRGELSLAELPPVKALRRYTAEFLGTVNRRRIYDLGQNISGILEAELRGAAGASLWIHRPPTSRR